MRFLAKFLLLSFTFSSLAALAKSPVPASSSPIDTLPGSYCAFVRQGDELYFFSEQLAEGTPNASGKICPGISLYSVSGENLSTATFEKTVAPNALINDLFSESGTLDPSRLLTRLGVQFSPKDKKFYAIAYVSQGYPPKGGKVVPALFESRNEDPMGEWAYRGIFKLDGRPASFFGSGGNLILNENHGSEVNHRSPLENKFAHYTDRGNSLILIYSNDGSQWHTFKDPDGNVADLRPARFQEDREWIFPSVVRTKNDGYFMFISVGWPPDGHRLLHSTDGLSWKVVGNGDLETNVGGLPKAKNVSLGYDEATDTLHLLITRTGSDHFKNIASVKPKSLVGPETSGP